MRLYQAGTGIYYVDGASLKVYYADFADWHPYSMMSLDRGSFDIDAETDMLMTRSGDAVVLLDGSRLALSRAGSVTDISGMLRASPAVCAAVLGAMALAVLLASFVIWYFVCVQGRSRVPMLVKWSVTLIAAAVLAVGAFARFALPGRMVASAAREARGLMSGLGDMAMESAGTPEDLASGMEAAARGLYGDVRAAYLEPDVDGSGLLRRVGGDISSVRWWLAGAMAALTALALCGIAGISRKLRRLDRGMEALIRGESGVKVGVSGGDELGVLGGALTSLARSMSDKKEEHRRLEVSYRRFVPERILSLLGKSSISEVDKSTFVTRELATMSFSFQFPEETYQLGGREIFNNVNEIIERTASIVTGRGGAVFNYSYNGFEAVFEEGSGAAVSAAVAVQQEVLELNREREAEERPRVSARVTLDEGSVILGVVGDDHQIEPAMLSASFSQTRALMELCVRLDATILCTQNVVTRAEGYSSRYIGKCSVGPSTVRLYEIFDGDPYESRKFKGQNLQRFSEGVYAFYEGDYPRAKSVFLSLVRRSSCDGCARHYLYLADRMEKEEGAEPSLDPRAY